MRSMIFDKYATIGKPWIISDSVIGYFEVDKKVAKENAQQWWANEGNFRPDKTGPASENLDSDTFKIAKDYAVLEAGRTRVKVA